MRNLYIKILISLSALIFISCVTSNTTSYVDREYTDYKASTIMIYFEGLLLQEVFEVEESMKTKLEPYNVEVIKYTDIIPPTKDYTNEERNEQILSTGADTLLIITITRDTTESYVPPSYVPGTTTTQLNTIGNYTYATTNTTPGYTTGGYSLTYPHMFTVTDLVDLTTGNTVMTAETITGGDEFTNFDMLIEKTCEDIVHELETKSLISRTQNYDN